MTLPRPPGFEPRRARELEDELHARMRAWLPSGSAGDDQRDFGSALLAIAARFGSEVAERLDRAGEKLRLGLLDWLAVQGEAARPARVPVVFRLAERARNAQPAPKATRLQVDVEGTSVILETETELLVLPGALQALVGADGATDAFYFAPPGLSSLAPANGLPVQWRLKTPADRDATTLQLDPEQGLEAGMIIELGGNQYGLAKVDKDVVTLDRPMVAASVAASVVNKSTAFTPFVPGAFNRQEHALYLGHAELLNIASKATIEVTGKEKLEGVDWHYWGRHGQDSRIDWHPLDPVPGERILLGKPPGAMELLALGQGGPNRWIRACARTLDPARKATLVDAFGLRINPPANATHGAPAKNEAFVPDVQAMANTTPLVLNKVFFPLGQTPRQFDALYLGCEEAFSKKGATVTLDFKLAEPVFRSLTPVQPVPEGRIYLAGVGADQRLHLLAFNPAEGSLERVKDRAGLRPPLPAADDTTPQGNQSIPLDVPVQYRLPAWSQGDDFFIAVAAKGAVWLWHESAKSPLGSGWLPLRSIDASGKDIDGLVYLTAGTSGYLVALYGRKLFFLAPNAPDASEHVWEQIKAKDGGPGQDMKTIAAVRMGPGVSGNGTTADGLIGVSKDNALFSIDLSNTQLKASYHELHGGFASDVTPVALRDAGLGLVIIAVAVDAKGQCSLVAYRSAAGTPAAVPVAEVPLSSPVFGGLLDFNVSAGIPVVVMSCGVLPGATVLASWAPFAAGDLNHLFTVALPDTSGGASGAPVLMPPHVLVPTVSGQALVAGFSLDDRLGDRSPLRTAVIAVDAADRFDQGNRIAIPSNKAGKNVSYIWHTVANAGVEFEGRVLYEFEGNAVEGPHFRTDKEGFEGTVMSQRTIDMADKDFVTAQNQDLLISTNSSTQLYRVATFKSETHTVIVTRNLDVDGGKPSPNLVKVDVPQSSHAMIRPMLRLDPATRRWPASVLDRTRLFFPGAVPASQAATVYKESGGWPEQVVLEAHWETTPDLDASGRIRFIVDGAVGAWKPFLGDTSTNPELSWEYWNGKGWWMLGNTQDATLSLKKSATVTFTLPGDIAVSDWAGQANYWIRARLVGGDYGQETVTVNTQNHVDGSSDQTVTRATTGIRPPAVASFTIAYRFDKAVAPTSVLVGDSGSLRDYSGANATGGAQVEAFVPLAQQLGRLSGEPGTDAAAASEPGRALYLGFDAPLSGAPVNILLLVEERQHDAFAPMTVAVLARDGFVPLVVQDATRALGESGVLSLALPVAPAPRELFGKTLSWLRLAPAPAPMPERWCPVILGAWLNGVWATAAETVTRELLGASQGEPNLVLYLARPPVLRDTLELRVREPLGEEERAALQAADPDQVRSDVENLPGDWVLWRQVADPGDALRDARVYALDEGTGAVCFGDGLHGKIPPIGPDAVMAFRYGRVASAAADKAAVDPFAVPGNAIAARTVLNLVSPIESVEDVVTADQAGGGAPAQDGARVLGAGVARLRHRCRAVTARDLEDLARARLPDIAQVRCMPGAGPVVLVVVMRGRAPSPRSAQRRALYRALADAGSPALAARGALRIDGPTLRCLRVALRLRVRSLDDTGSVGRIARQRIAALFDSVTGGIDGEGWPLGDSPGAPDVAGVLADIAGLAGVANIDLSEVTADGELQWPATLRGRELAWLADDSVRIVFEMLPEAA